MSEISLRLSKPEAEYVINALAQRPYIEVHQLLQKIASQMRMAEPPSAVEEEERLDPHLPES
jgi:hypothetical protein